MDNKLLLTTKYTNMNYTETYPNGGTNKMWEPLHLIVDFPQAKGLTVHAKTFDRDSCEIILR